MLKLFVAFGVYSRDESHDLFFLSQRRMVMKYLCLIPMLGCYLLFFPSCTKNGNHEIDKLDLRIPEDRNSDILLKFPEDSLTANEKNALISLIKWGDIGSPVDHPKKLKQIIIQYNSKITDNDIHFLKEFSNLESLYLVRCPGITDQGMVVLEFLPNLKLLSLGGTNVTESSVPRIAKLNNLETLYLGVQYIKDNPLTPIDEPIEGNQPQFSNKTLEILQSSSLKSLSFSSATTITDEGLIYLTPMKNLSNLMIISDFITVKGAEYLSEIPHLKDVSLRLSTSDEKSTLNKIRKNGSLVLYEELNETD